MKIVTRSYKEVNENLDETIEEICRRKYPRETLVKKLRAYNDSIGNQEAPVENLLEEKCFCVVTGQQLGFFGGPSYTILKAISCLQWAKKLKALPLFWLATEDHDVGEVDHTYTVDERGNLKKHHLSLPQNGQFVEDLQLNDAQIEQVESFARETNSLIPSHSKRYATLMASILVELFKGTGLVFVEPHLLRSEAVPFFQKELKESRRIRDLAPEEYSQDGHTHLFMKGDHRLRTKILEVEPAIFSVGHHQYTLDALMKRIETNPEEFSMNVLGRTLFQSTIFPTALYVAGPNELKYYSQLEKYHSWHEVPFPYLVERMHVTFVASEQDELLKRLELNPWDSFPTKWEELAQFSQIGEEEPRRNKRKKIIRKAVEDHGFNYTDLHRLTNEIHPRGRAQERVLNWFAFQGKTQKNLVQTLLQEVPEGEKQEVYYYL